MPKYVHLNVGRQAGIEILKFLGAFAFGEMGGNALQAAGVKLPTGVTNAMAGAVTPFNTSLNSFLHYIASNDKEANAKIFFQKAHEAGFSQENASNLYEHHWRKADKLMLSEEIIDAQGLAKKLDCSIAEAAFMLRYSNHEKLFKFSLVVNETDLLGILIAGTVTYFTGPIPLANPFLSRLVTAAAAQVGTRVLQESIKGIQTLGILANKPSREDLERTALINEAYDGSNDSPRVATS